MSNENINKLNNNNNNQENQLKIYYSNYGYIQINQKDYLNNEISLIDFTQVPYNKNNKNINNNSLLIGKINKNSIFPKITIRIKTLYDTREIYKIELEPEDKISLIFQKIIEIEKNNNNKKEKFDFKNYNNSYRIISAKGQIIQLNIYKKIYEENIYNNQLLILSKNPPIHFSEINHGNQIIIENNIYANKIYGEDEQIALINKGYNNGISYTEFILETEPDEKSIIIGVCLKRSNNNYYLNNMNNFWGYILSDAKKICMDYCKDYGKICKIYDKIGILLEFNYENKCNISFYVNGENQGLAFENLDNNIYFPCVVLLYEEARVKVVEYSKIPEDVNII